MYTIQVQDQKKSLADWGVSDIQRETENQGIDRVVLTVQQDQPDWQPGQYVSIFKDDERIFYGIITRTPTYADAQNYQITYEVEGPFWYLEHLVYQQQWQEIEEKKMITKYKGRVVLGQNTAGEMISAQAQIEDILQYAIACEAPFQMGNIQVDHPLHIEETKDISCAQALYKVLRWAPDGVLWFDYSCLGWPKLHIQSAQALDIYPIYFNQPPVSRYQITPRHDRMVKGVMVQYESIHQINAETYTTTQIDAYPEHLSPTSPQVMVLTVELMGSKTYEYTQPIEVLPIEPESPIWWQNYLPELKRIDASTISISHIESNTTLPHALCAGAIAEWMGCEVQEAIIKAHLTYETPEGLCLEHPVAVRLQATDAETKKYRYCAIEKKQQQPIHGLAEKLYASFGQLGYEGYCELLDDQLIPVGLVGKKLQIIEPHLGTVDVPIQVVRSKWSTGRVTIQFGLPEHLGLHDYAQLMRSNRQRLGLDKSSSRSTGKMKAKTSIENAKYNQLDHADRGLGKIKKWTLLGDQSQLITFDTSLLPPGSQMTLKEENVCENGILMSRLVLSTDPY